MPPARKLVAEQGGDIALAAVPATTVRIFRLIGLDRVLTIHPDASAATTPAPRRADTRPSGAPSFELDTSRPAAGAYGSTEAAPGA
ncbi:STAS domain-containing protein [Streptomyces sp. NBC_00344]|uniref:STAS domain-containing protein n=1 Tax=Streptomyces sp. NBC_00344 TaxID=2975720 RepID=UPI002E22281B